MIWLFLIPAAVFVIAAACIFGYAALEIAIEEFFDRF